MKIGLRKAYLLASQFYYTYEGCIFTEKATEELDRGAICEPFSHSVSQYSQELKKATLESRRCFNVNTRAESRCGKHNVAITLVFG